jgi:hypothetical protein
MKTLVVIDRESEVKAGEARLALFGMQKEHLAAAQEPAEMTAAKPGQSPVSSSGNITMRANDPVRRRCWSRRSGRRRRRRAAGPSSAIPG